MPEQGCAPRTQERGSSLASPERKTAKHAGRRTEQRLRAAPVLTQRHGDRAGGSLALPSMPTNATRPRSHRPPSRTEYVMPDIVCQPGDLVKRRYKRQKARLPTSLVLPAADHLPPRFTRPSNSPPLRRPTDRTSREWGAQETRSVSEATEREHVESTRVAAQVKHGRTLFVTEVHPAPLPWLCGTHRPPRRGLARPPRRRLPAPGALVGRRAPHALLGLAHEVRGGADGADGAGHNGTPSRSNDTGTGCRASHSATSRC